MKYLVNNYIKMDQPLKYQPYSVIKFVHQHVNLYRKYATSIAGMSGLEIINATIKLGYKDAFNDLAELACTSQANKYVHYIKKLGVSGVVRIDADSGTIIVTPLNKQRPGELKK